MLHEKTNKEIYDDLSCYVYGHDKAKKALINLVNRAKIRHYQKYLLLQHKEALMPTSKILLVGGSGTGKTFLLESLQRLVCFPLLKIDATRLTVTGAASDGIKCKDLEKMIVQTAEDYMIYYPHLFHSLEGTVDQTVVFIDEFDKVASNYDGSSGNWNQHVQTNFLTLFDNKDKFAGVSWVFAGAFSGLEKENNSNKSLGFCAANEDIDEDACLDEAIIKYGLLPEIVGRLTAIAELEKLSEDDFYNILKYKILPHKLAMLEYFNIEESTLTDEQLKEMAKKARNSEQGARYLHRELDKYFLDAEFNYEEFKYDIE